MATKQNETPVPETKKEIKVQLKDEPLFASQTSPIPIKKVTGEYYYYDGIRANGRTRICAHEKDRGKFPPCAHVIGWVCK